MVDRHVISRNVFVLTGATESIGNTKLSKSKICLLDHSIHEITYVYSQDNR